jgi:hypothetical protein
VLVLEPVALEVAAAEVAKNRDPTDDRLSSVVGRANPPLADEPFRARRGRARD